MAASPRSKSFSRNFIILECGRDGDFEIEKAANIPQEISLALTYGKAVIDVGGVLLRETLNSHWCNSQDRHTRTV